MPELSTHQLIDAEDVKDNVVILKNKSLRMVLMVSSINFSLKSQDEQQAIIERFQDMVNSLDWTLQIVVQSRTLDITEYLNFLASQTEKQTNELLKMQTAEYVDFIEELVKISNIMAKFFYVVVSINASALSSESKSFFSKIFKSKKQANEISQKDLDFESKKNELNMRVGQITGLLGAMGLRAIPLGREELVELLYTSYNPGAILKHKNLEMLIATGEEAKQVE